MEESSSWLSERDAIETLRVDKLTLEELRERGCLKPGYHWRSSTDTEQLPWKPKVFYRINACKEVIEYIQNNDASSDKKAA